MSKFKKLLKKKHVEEALGQHPLAEAEAQVREDYLQGLVFVAVEDENFSDEERDYIRRLMRHIGLDESKLEAFEQFADGPDEEALMAFIERLQGMDEALRRNFIMEVVLLAFRDENFDEREQSMFNDYVEMLGLKNEAERLRELATAIARQDMDTALAYYGADRALVESLRHLFALAEMDVPKAFADLYRWEWAKWKCSTGKVDNNNLVATRPVSARQIAVFLNALALEGRLEHLPGGKAIAHKDDEGKLTTLIEDLEASNLRFEHGRFVYDEDGNACFVGASTGMPGLFAAWLNARREEQVAHLYFVIDCLLELSVSARAYLSDKPEMVRMSSKDIDNNQCADPFQVLALRYVRSMGLVVTYYKQIMNGGVEFDYADGGDLESGVAYTFRLMRLADDEDSEKDN